MATPNITAHLKDLFFSTFSSIPESIVQINGAGSDRQYFRLSSKDKNVIGTFCSDSHETKKFLSIANALKKEGINVPEIYAVDSNSNFYLQEDCGNSDLLNYINNGEGQELLNKVVSTLAHIHSSKELSGIAHNANSDFDYDAIMMDLHYFKYCFLKPLGVEFNENALEENFKNFTKKIINIDASLWGFMYRDCQSRNIIVDDNNQPHWIDFQGARFGPCVYDLVSLLWQAKANIANEEKSRLLQRYTITFTPDCSLQSKIMEAYNLLIPLRIMQTLGAYGYRGLVQKKSHFIESIRPALKNFRDIVSSLIMFPELQKLSDAMDFAWQSYAPVVDTISTTLTIRIESFSFRKGYPPELKGNGGGFIFDCRYMTNPGRFEEYKALTGLNHEVADFLLSQGEVQLFLNNCRAMVSPAIEKYLSRNFKNLFIGFGCTGGQHRSVFCAESLAKMLHEEFPNINIEIYHRAQSIFKQIS